MKQLIYILLLLLGPFSIHQVKALEIQAMAFQNGKDSLSWDWIKMSLLGLKGSDFNLEGDLLIPEGQYLFEVKEKENWLHLSMPLFPLNLRENERLLRQQTLSLNFNGSLGTIQGRGTKNSFSLKEWQAHRLGRMRVITLSFAGKIYEVGFSFKLKNLRDEEEIFISIDVEKILQIITVFRPVP